MDHFYKHGCNWNCGLYHTITGSPCVNHLSSQPLLRYQSSYQTQMISIQRTANSGSLSTCARVRWVCCGNLGVCLIHFLKHLLHGDGWSLPQYCLGPLIPVSTFVITNYCRCALALYWKGPLVKCELALASGKKEHDKRASIKERDWQRDKQRIAKDYRR